MSDLAAKACVPCRGGVPPLKGEELASLQRQVDGWNVIEGHHPDISLAWGKVGITTWTHKINGLTESDFILAAKIDQLYKS
jgi:4a-hydroxytetrahydrobiopterin dehydratase